MKTPEQIIEIIRSDSPCVFDIMNEQIQEWDKGNFPQSNSTYTWEEWYKDNPDIVPPTAQELLDTLSDYDGDNYDVHYWSGRYAQMKMDSIDTAIVRVPFTESDINDLQEGEHFHWTYGGINLFIFNTDSTPQFDPDSDEYDPTVELPI